MVPNFALTERGVLPTPPLSLVPQELDAANTYNKRLVLLPTGTLSLQVTRSDLDLDHLLDIAARRNPKRGFSFMSHVICRQYPTRPRDARRVMNIVAGRIPSDLPGPVVCIAMAEMAIAFGQGVHESYVHRTGRNDVLFLHSTRFILDRDLAVEFKEEHSHASQHNMYLPEGEYEQSLLRNARSLVLLDDEVTTGTTFVNLATAFKAVSSSIENVVTGVIADWRGEEVVRKNAQALGPNYKSIAVIEGQYKFQAHPMLSTIVMPQVSGNGAAKDEVLTQQFGRLGVTQPLAINARITRRLGLRRGQRVLILGTGEHSYVPFLLAEQLERDGVEAYCQATSRSPLMEYGPVRYARTYRDNYGDGIENYLYNVDAGDYDRVFIVTETPASMLDPQLVSDLNATVLEGLGDV